jgi:Flp pilus assembly protein TadG
VEFALLVPVLVLIISGIVGFGVVFAQQLALGNAARQAARSAAVDGPLCGTGGAAGASSPTHLTSEAKTNATTIFVTTDNISVEIKRAGAAPTDVYTTDWTGTCVGGAAPAGKACAGSTWGDNVYVRMRYTSVLSLPFFKPSFNLSAVGAFRCEFS